MDDQRLRLEQFLPYQLSVTSNAVSGVIARTYESLFGLRIPEWRLIAVLAEEASLTQQALVHRTEMDKMTVSRAAQALVSRGLVLRSAHGSDKRSHDLSLSDAGQSLYAEVAPRALALERALLRDLPAGDIDTLWTTLARLKAAAERLR